MMRKSFVLVLAGFLSNPLIFSNQNSCRKVRTVTNRKIVEGIQRWGTKVWVDTAEPTKVQEAAEIGATGGTSNPSLISKAIQENPTAYKERISELIEEYTRGGDFYRDILMELEEIHQEAGIKGDVFSKAILLELSADLIANALRELSGPMSWEVDPRLYDNSQAMVREAELIYKIAEARGLDPGRIYIKIPATKAGMEATEELIGKGINVNLTLVFSISQGLEGLKRYELGSDKAQERGLEVDEIRMCISPFLGRWDDYFKKQGLNIVDPNGNPVAGLYFAKLLHQKLIEEVESGDYAFRGRPELIMASIRNVNHIQQLIGADILTIPPKILLSSDLASIDVAKPTIEEPIPLYLVAELLKNDGFRVSMRDEKEGGFGIGEFDFHPLVIEGNEKFIKPYNELLNLIEGLLHSNP